MQSAYYNQSASYTVLKDLFILNTLLYFIIISYLLPERQLWSAKITYKRHSFPSQDFLFCVINKTLLLLVFKNDIKMTQQSGVGENVWEADQKHNELLGCAENSWCLKGNLEKNILHRKEFWLYITFDLSLLRFFITENICWKTHFLSWWLSNLPLTTADTILFMPLPLVTKETSPTNQLYSILQTEARMIERALFSKTFTGLTSSTCLCLKGYMSSADEDERTEHTEFLFLSRSALRFPLWLWSVSWYNSSAS